MPYTKQTWNDGSTSTPLSAARLTVIEQGIADAHNPALVTSLPGSPVDGQLAWFDDGAGNTILYRYKLSTTTWQRLAGPIVAKAKKSGTYPGSLQSLANSTETTCTLDAYDFTRSPATAWPAVGNNITPPVPGIWMITAYVLFWAVNSAADTTGGRQLSIKRQTTNVLLAKDSKPAFGPLNVATACAVDVTLDMSGGTFGIFITAYQTSGVAVNIEPYLTLEYVGA